MRVMVQRVSFASVRVDDHVVGEIGRGLLLFVGIGPDTTQADLAWMVNKIAGLRIFEDDAGKMNRSVRDIGGACLAVSQFTLYGDCKKGFRPSFNLAASPTKGASDFDAFVGQLRGTGVLVETGVFQADMKVALLNDGPVTLMLEREGT